MSRLGQMKMMWRLRIAVPIQAAPWRKNLHSALPSAGLLRTYWDNSSEKHTDLLHPTLLWEDPRCPALQHPTGGGDGEEQPSMKPAAAAQAIAAESMFMPVGASSPEAKPMPVG